MGQRIVMLKGMGEVHHSVDSSRVSSTVGINIVSPVARVDGSRLWIVRPLFGCHRQCHTSAP